MKQRREGSCHCGRVRFRTSFDLQTETSRCNCSICKKSRLWKAAVGLEDFELLSGENALTEYRFGSCTIQHQFCATCGIKMFGRGEREGEPFVVFNVATIEATDEELASATVTYQDGRSGRMAAPLVTKYL